MSILCDDMMESVVTKKETSVIIGRQGDEDSDELMVLEVLENRSADEEELQIRTKRDIFAIAEFPSKELAEKALMFANKVINWLHPPKARK